jgi:hypothetical protein
MIDLLDLGLSRGTVIRAVAGDDSISQTPCRTSECGNFRVPRELWLATVSTHRRRWDRASIR